MPNTTAPFICLGARAATNDDKIAKSIEGLLNREVVITEKLDGANICFEADGVFARSHSGPPTHASFDLLKAKHAQIKHLLAPDYQVFGEWVFAVHSLAYDKLPGYLFLFGARDLTTSSKVLGDRASSRAPTCPRPRCKPSRRRPASRSTPSPRPDRRRFPRRLRPSHRSPSRPPRTVASPMPTSSRTTARRRTTPLRRTCRGSSTSPSRSARPTPSSRPSSWPRASLSFPHLHSGGTGRRRPCGTGRRRGACGRRAAGPGRQPSQDRPRDHANEAGCGRAAARRRTGGGVPGTSQPASARAGMERARLPRRGAGRLLHRRRPVGSPGHVRRLDGARAHGARARRHHPAAAACRRGAACPTGTCSAAGGCRDGDRQRSLARGHSSPAGCGAGSAPAAASRAGR